MQLDRMGWRVRQEQHTMSNACGGCGLEGSSWEQNSNAEHQVAILLQVCVRQKGATLCRAQVVELIGAMSQQASVGADNPFGFEVDTCSVVTREVVAPLHGGKESKGKVKEIAQGSSSKKPSAGRKQCPGCLKWQSITEFPANSKYCLEDKRALDNMTKLAKREGQASMTWLAEARATERGVRGLLRNYHIACEDAATAGAGSKKRKWKAGSWSLVECIQRLEAEDAWDIVEQGEMMNKEAFIRHLNSSDPGKKAEEVLLLWQQMLEDTNIVKKDIGGIPHCRVVTKNFMNRRGTVARSTEARGTCMSFKKPNADQVSKVQREVLLGGGMASFGGRSLELGSMAESMVGGIEEGFSCKAMAVSNVRDLLPEEHPLSAGMSGASSSGGGAPAALMVEGNAESADAQNTSETPNKSQQGVFLDLNRQISTCIRATKKNLTALQKQLRDLGKKYEEQEEAMNGQDFVGLESWRETLLVRDRRVVLQAVLSQPQEGQAKLVEYMQVIHTKRTITFTDDDGNDQSRSLQLTPPCEALEEVLPVAVLLQNVVEMDYVQSESELMAKYAALERQKACINEVLASCRGALRDFQKALKAKEIKQKRAGTGPRCGPGDAGGPQKKAKQAMSPTSARGNDILLDGAVVEEAVSITEVASSMDKGIVTAALDRGPVVVVSQTLKDLCGGPDIVEATQSFSVPFQSWAKTAPTAKAGRVVTPPPVAQKLASWMVGCFPAEVQTQCLHTKLPASMESADSTVVEPLLVPQFLGMAGCKDYFGLQRECVSTLQLQLQGSRNIIMIDGRALAEFMQAKEGAVEVLQCPLLTQRLVAFLQNITSSVARELISRGNVLYQRTVAPGELLFIPSGYILCERCHNVNICVRQTVLYPTKEDNLSWVRDSVVKAGKSPAILAAIMKALNLLGAESARTENPAAHPDPDAGKPAETADAPANDSGGALGEDGVAEQGEENSGTD